MNSTPGDLVKWYQRNREARKHEAEAAVVVEVDMDIEGEQFARAVKP